MVGGQMEMVEKSVLEPSMMLLGTFCLCHKRNTEVLVLQQRRGNGAGTDDGNRL